MNKNVFAKRFLAWVLAFALAFTTVFANGTTVEAASSKAVKKVTVKIDKKNVTKKTYTLTKGKSKTLKVSVSPKSAKKSVSYKSSKKSVATVSKKGKVTAKKAGTAKITVTVTGKNKKKKSTWVKIKVVNKKSTSTTQATTTEQPTTTEEQVTAVQVSAATTSVQIGSSTKVIATVVPSTAKTTIKWSSSNAAVATVDKNGIVVGLKEGTTDIIATASNGVSGRVTITVNAVPVAGVALDNSNISLTVGNKSVLKELVMPSNATNKRVKWSSSDATVASVINGTVTAVAAGTATITVETEDGGFKASATVTVTDDSKEDVNGLVAEVSNSIDGYDNTVLVGTDAKITVRVTKDGAPLGNDEVHVDLKPVSGYASYYYLSKDDISIEDGVGYVYLRLKDTYKSGDVDYTAMLNSDFSNAAYAGFELTFTSGGANYVQSIPVSFAQILPETYNSGSAISVENQHDSTLKEIEKTDSYYATTTSKNNQGYNQEYVVDQQVSSNLVEDGEHEVVLDAAPVLVLPETVGESGSDTYLKENINYDCSEYSVYRGEDTAYVLEDVPGGLNYATLIFSKLKLSKYSRIIVRAYYADTNIPITDDDGNLVQRIITDKSEISSTSEGKSIQVRGEVFNETTAAEKTIDLKVFAESAGQVSEDDNVGFKLISVTGPWNNQQKKFYEYVRLGDCVEWSFDGQKPYTVETELEDAKSYLGEDFYNVNNVYKISMPAFPDTGNAVITAYSKATGEAIAWYLYPTVVEDKANVLKGKNSNYVFQASSEQVKKLTSYTKTVADGRCTIDSNKAGFVQVTATISAFDKVNYTVSSFVQWSPIPDRIVTKAKDYYALSGQTVTLTATVKDKEGNLTSNIPVEWSGYEGEKISVDLKQDTTDSNGQAVLKLSAEKIVDLADVTVDVGNSYDVTLQVADNTVSTGHASIHWVKPGIYYSSDVESGTEYNTAEETNAVKTEQSEYTTGSTWIIGTKVVGITAQYDVEIMDISNIKINMSSSADTINVTKTDKGNGVCTVYSQQKGTSETTAQLGGLLDSTKKPVITVKEYTGEVDENNEKVYKVVKYTSVGEGDFSMGANLIIPINWVTGSAKLSLINSNTKFDIANADSPIVYISVKDNYGNPVEATEVSYSITDANGASVKEATTATTNKNGLVIIPVEKPKKVVTYTVAANITNSTDIQTTRIHFVSGTEDYTINADGITSDVNTNTITVTFTSPVNADLLTAHPDFFTVMNGTSTLDIESITVDSSNSKKVIIKTSQSFTTTDLKVTVKSSCEDGNITYYNLNSNGVQYTAPVAE